MFVSLNNIKTLFIGTAPPLQQAKRSHTKRKRRYWAAECCAVCGSSVVDILFMSFPGKEGGGCSRKRPLEASCDEGAAARRTHFPPFEPPPAPTTETEIDSNGDHDPYGEDSDIFEEAHLPNDTMATVLALQNEFYGHGNNSAPGSRPSARPTGERTGVVLQHQM